VTSLAALWRRCALARTRAARETILRVRRPGLRTLPGFLLLFVLAAGGPSAYAQASASIPRVKLSIVAVGTFQTTRAPQFRFAGTGFVVGDGTLVATNAHVLPAVLEPGADPEVLVAMLPTADPARPEARRLTALGSDPEHDLAVLKMAGAPLPALPLRDSTTVAEGDLLLFTGFPIGTVLGLFPATHRATVAAIAPVAIPAASGRQLDAKVLRRLREGTFPIFQLDATAYPGQSGSPLYDGASGEVVGIINMVLVKSTKESALSQPSGISYAIPSRLLADLLARVGR
jgi:S1-C subfamily serine protease